MVKSNDGNNIVLNHNKGNIICPHNMLNMLKLIKYEMQLLSINIGLLACVGSLPWSPRPEL